MLMKLTTGVCNYFDSKAALGTLASSVETSIEISLNSTLNLVI